MDYSVTAVRRIKTKWGEITTQIPSFRVEASSEIEARQKAADILGDVSAIDPGLCAVEL